MPRSKDEECRALYRLIQGHADMLLAVRNKAQALSAAASLMARAKEIHEGAWEQTTIPGTEER